ncbi:MAG TPA: hypothetical protein VK066_09990 [Chloroflexota bacterium]|nr:hypothetical protein [Chloroflexota bacterium]
MASQALMDVLARAREDGHFYQLLQSDPMTALAGDALTPDERRALQDRDRGALVALGVPAELAHWWGIQH